MGKQSTDIVIISYNTLNHTLECIKSINQTAKDIINLIIVVDNGSTDGTLDAIKSKYPDIKLISNNENLGYARAVNIGVKSSNSDFVIISNNDVIYPNDSIEYLLEYLIENTKVGAVGPQQLYPDGDYQYSFGDLPGTKLGLKKLFLINHFQEYLKKKNWRNDRAITKQVPYLDGAVIATKRIAFDEVEGFDEDYFFYTEEADYCHKLKQKGWAIIHNPKALVTHFRGASDSYNGLNKKNHNGLNKKKYSEMISSKIKFCKKHLSFQSGKLYIICEIVYSFNMTVLWSLKSFFQKLKPTVRNHETAIQNGAHKHSTPDSKLLTSKRKIAYNKLMFHLWLDEFNKFLRSGEK
ncbi:MAG: glycosyltransferase family 2 protein [bacterium]